MTLYICRVFRYPTVHEVQTEQCTHGSSRIINHLREIFLYYSPVAKLQIADIAFLLHSHQSIYKNVRD